MSTQYDPAEYPELLQDFASYKLTIQNCSPKTVSEYMLDLRSFFRYLLARKQKIDYGTEEFDAISILGIDLAFLSAVTTSDIYNFLVFAQSRMHNASAARARKLSAIKGLFKYLTSKRMLLAKNPAAEVETPKKAKTLPKFLTLEESVELLDTIRRDTDTRPWLRLRNYTMVTLFLNCGMRLSELVGINLGDIDKYLRSVRVVGKGAKERMIYLNDACRAALAEYLPERMSEAHHTAATRALFLSQQQKRISNRYVELMVENYLREAGLENRRLSVHKLRHTAATLMYQNGVDVRVLQSILGHEQLNTTQIYTHLVNADMERAMNRNPLSGIDTDGTVIRRAGKSAPDPTALESAVLPFSSMTGEAADVGREDVEDVEEVPEEEDGGTDEE